MKPVTILKDLTDLLYPRRCPVCDGILDKKTRYVCRECSRRLELIKGAVCCVCGKPLERDSEEYCFDCRKRRHVFEICRAPFLYRGTVKESLMRFKYMGRAEYAAFYGSVMAEFGRQKGVLRGVDLIVPVPVHRNRRIQRGYNQAELLASRIAAETGIPLDAGAAVRTRKTKALKTLSGEKRRQSLDDAFAVPKSKRRTLEGKRILLVDDIYTTGSTADAVCRRLLEAGADSAAVLCLAVSPGFS